MTEHSPFAAFGYALSAANLLAKSNNFRFFGMAVTELMSSKYRNFLKPATLCATRVDSELMTSIVRIALHKPTGQFMHIDNASNGLSCDCECLKCSEKLEAIQGKIRTKHFRHHTNRECEGSQETALHELAKQMLVEHNQIQLPKYGLITYSEPKAEQRLEKIRPDVSAQFNDQSIHFEIFVSHLVDDKKDKYIKEKQLRCVEIDLSLNETSNYDEIKQKVLQDIDNKRIIFWEPNPVNQTNENSGCVLQIVAFIAVVFGLSLLFNVRR